MRAVLEAMGALHINLGDQANRVHVKAILSYTEANAQTGLTPELGGAIKALWQDAGVQVRCVLDRCLCGRRRKHARAFIFFPCLFFQVPLSLSEEREREREREEERERERER